MKCYFNDINHFALLSREEEVELGTRIQESGDREAIDQLVRANLKLVVKIANDYSKFGLDVEDLVSEGNIGLMKAAEKFDPKFGVKFSTYSSWWIKQMIKRALGNQSRTIRLPLHVLQKLRELDRDERELGYELGRDPSDGELARQNGLPRKKIDELRRVSQPVASIDEHSSADGEDHQHLGAMICDESAPDPSEVAVNHDLNENLAEVLSCLNAREREVLVSRFGIGGGDRQTLEQVGAVLGVTRERIRQIQQAALGKLRSALVLREQPPKPKQRRSKSRSHLIFNPLPKPEAIPA
ncbi:MAG: sigma-70 family RNA polymerase sigma factor [Verrucomicrobiales bacterium]